MKSKQKSGPDAAELAVALEIVDADAVEALLEVAHAQPLAAGAELFTAGTAYDHLVRLVYDGELELERPTGERERLGEGAIIGLANYLDGGPYLSSARALVPSHVLTIPAARLHELEQRYASLASLVNRQLAARLRRRSPVREVTGGAMARPVRSVMKSPLSTCSAVTSLREAFALMDARRIGSLGALDDDGKLVGVLTYAGLARALVDGASPGDSIAGVACEQPVTIAPDDPLWRAEECLARFDIKYLVVMDGRRPLGMISQTDLLRTVVSEGTSGNVIARIRDAAHVESLADEYRNIGELAAAALETHRSASEALRYLSEIHLSIQRRCVAMALRETRDAGMGAAPGQFVVLIMGSGGRREMFLNPDQDNGLVYVDPPEAQFGEVERWYTEFAERLNANLAHIGYELCPGDIMARNPRYRGSLTHWRQQITRMAELPDETSARWSNIVFDFDTLAGNEVFTQLLREHVNETVQQSPGLLAVMTAADAEGTAPLGLFDRLITSDEPGREGKIDLKRNGLRLIADAARILSLDSGIGMCNTSDRLRALVHQGELDADLAESAAHALDELQGLVLAHQVECWRAGRPVDALIDPDRLNSHQRSALRVSLRAVKRLQEELQGRYAQNAF
jgi:CBS domain-containing protein